MMERIKVLILDGNPIFREGLAAALSREDGIEVVGHTGSAEEGLALQKMMMPGVVILDVDLPRAEGLGLATRLRRFCPVTATSMPSSRESKTTRVRAASKPNVPTNPTVVTDVTVVTVLTVLTVTVETITAPKCLYI